MLIRQGTVADLPGVHALLLAWEQEEITYGLVASDLSHLHDRLNEFFRVAEVDGQLVGMVAASEHVSDGLAVIPAGERYLEVDDLYVCPEWRSQGIGRVLLDTVLARAEQDGIRYQLVYSATKDVRRVMRFYENCGFESWYIQMYRRSPEKGQSNT